MIINETPVDVQGNLVFDEEIEMGIDDAARVMIVQSLIDMYPNPYVATLREYASNAYDAHLVAGQTRPVEVTLPNPLSPVLTIQDWGVGMSRETLAIYGQFGASTKRDNNDEIGGFGLGSKSGLAVASQFTVTSIKDGKKNTVAIGRNEHGAPRMGLMAEEDTDEPNGTLVCIPTSKTEAYRAAVDEALVFLGWPLGSILINGSAPALSVHDETKFLPLGGHGWYDIRPEGERDHWNQWRNTSALVGPLHIKYDYVQTTDLDIPEGDTDNLFGEGYASLEGKKNVLARLIVSIPNGSVSLLRSRESFVYNNTTKLELTRSRQLAIRELAPVIQKEIDSAATPLEGLIALHANRQMNLGVEFTYKGETPKFTRFEEPTDEKAAPLGVYSSVKAKWDTYNYTMRVERAAQKMTHWNNLLTGLVANTRQGSPVKRVLITDTPSETTKPASFSYYDTAVHSVTKYAGTGIRAIARSHGESEGSYNNYTLYFVSERDSAFDKWDRAIFSEIMTYKEYEKLLALHRAAVRTENASGKGSSSSRPSVTMDKAMVARMPESGGRAAFKEQVIGELDTETVYVLLRASGVAYGASGRTLEDRLADAMRYKNRYYENRSVFETVYHAVNAHEKPVRFLYESNSMKTRDYASAGLTVTSVTDFVRTHLNKQASGLTKEFLLAFQTTDDGYFDWARGLSDEDLETVENPTTREWLTTVRGIQKRTGYTDLVNFLNSRESRIQTAKAMGIEIKRTKAERKHDKAPLYAERYPLAKSVQHARWGDVTTPIRELIEYINWIDAKLA